MKICVAKGARRKDVLTRCAARRCNSREQASWPSYRLRRGALCISHGAVVRDVMQVLLAHRAARDLALVRCWIKHRRRPGTELSVVLEEHAGRGSEIAEPEMG